MKAIVVSLCVIAGAISSLDKAAAAPQNERNLKFAHRQRAVAPHRVDFEPKPEVTGVIPRAVRGGNPLEMLDPFAPAKYGTSEESITSDPEQPGRVDGIKLLNVSF